MKEVFDLVDIKPQITEKQADYLEKCIFLAKETGKTQEVTLSLTAKPLIVWQSGKIMFKPNYKKKEEKHDKN